MIARRDAAIEASVTALPWMLRGVATTALASGARYCPAYDLRVTERDVSVICEGAQAFERPLDGAAMSWTRASDGARFETRAGWSGDALALSFAGERGGRSTTFRSVDGQLEVSITLESERLDQPVAYRVRYDRVAPGP